jgi:hypothetical protein
MADPLSNWHDFRPLDFRTYSKVNAPVQVRYADGDCQDGMIARIFIEADSLKRIAKSPALLLKAKEGYWPVPRGGEADIFCLSVSIANLGDPY